MIDVEYERIQKKCFRLSHEKQACPLLKGTMKGSAKGRDNQNFPNVQRVAQRQHNTSLANDIMPLFAPSVHPGFEPPARLIEPSVRLPITN